MTKLNKETKDALKLCLDGSNCMRCPRGNDGKAILTCRELLESLAEFAGIKVEKAVPKDE